MRFDFLIRVDYLVQKYILYKHKFTLKFYYYKFLLLELKFLTIFKKKTNNTQKNKKHKGYKIKKSQLSGTL